MNTAQSRLKAFYENPKAILLAAVILFIPLLFIGNRHSHDWGDDFAQYIHQAANIVQGIPQSETGFIYSQQNFIGPQAYPSGFPLLLAPVYALAGNNIAAFLTFISILYILLGLLLIVYFRQFFSWITALILASIFVYNPQMVLFKGEVMSDIPFTALLVLNFLLYQKAKSGNLRGLFIMAVTTGFMVTMRPTGFIFIAAVFADQLVVFWKRKKPSVHWIAGNGIMIIVPILVYFLVNVFIFKLPSGGSLSDYLSFYNSGKMSGIIPANLSHHIESARYLYLPQTGALMGASLLLASGMLTMALLGFIQRILRGPEVIDWFFIFYVIMLLLFPDNNSAFRLMIPLGFIILIYAATGFKNINLLSHVSAQKKAIVLGSIVLLMFLPGIVNIARTGDNIINGPQQKTSVEVFDFISKNVPADSVVVFAKPRALALYGGCRSMADPRTTNPTLFHLQVVQNKASYLLINSTLTSELMLRYSRVMQNRMTKIFGNKDFELYRINPVIR